MSIYPTTSPGRSLLSAKGENENLKRYVGSDLFPPASGEDSGYTTRQSSKGGEVEENDGERERIAASERRRHSLNYPFPAFLAPRALIKYPPVFVEYTPERR